MLDIDKVYFVSLHFYVDSRELNTTSFPFDFSDLRKSFIFLFQLVFLAFALICYVDFCLTSYLRW
jgi:hypothetical protein